MPHTIIIKTQGTFYTHLEEKSVMETFTVVEGLTVQYKGLDVMTVPNMIQHDIKFIDAVTLFLNKYFSSPKQSSDSYPEGSYISLLAEWSNDNDLDHLIIEDCFSSYLEKVRIIELLNSNIPRDFVFARVTDSDGYYVVLFEEHPIHCQSIALVFATYHIISCFLNDEPI